MQYNIRPIGSSGGIYTAVTRPVFYTRIMTSRQKLVLAIAILASSIAFLDGTIVNVALPAIAADLHGGLALQQWVVNAYAITLGACMLLAGSLSDLFGRKKILHIGLVGFGIASVLCAVAPWDWMLTTARGLQGLAGALLVPSSLALIMSNFSGKAQARAIGIWTALTGVAMIFGPLLGGFLVDAASWRWIFAINVPLVVFTVWLLSTLPTAEAMLQREKIDIGGAVLGTGGLALAVYGLIEQPTYGWSSPFIIVPLLVGIGMLAAFVRHEHRAAQPMLPLQLFRVRNFSAGNIATAAIYGGLSMSMFLITIFIQQIGGYSAFQAGLALLPITVLMILLSSTFGTLAGKFGPRLFMTSGPIIAGIGFITMLGLDEQALYWTQLFPGVVLFGLGLSITVAPLTAAVLGDIDSNFGGIASAVNNAVSRVAGLLATAAAGLIVGSQITVDGFHKGLWVVAGLLIAGGIISFFGIRNHPLRHKAGSI